MKNELVIRLGFFFGVFLVMALWEMAAPQRVLRASRSLRWFSNLCIVAIYTLLVRLIFPVFPVDLAVLSLENGWGVFNHFGIDTRIAVCGGVLALDFIIYIQHVMFHTIPVLWRLHMMHHADPDIDVSTGLRFHPLEIIISMVIKLSAVALLGPPALAVLIFEILLNGTSMFNHSNVAMPAGLDRFLRLLLVTPDMHRVHHSVSIRETNSNFGFNFSWWDRMLGTYRPQPAAGHEGMTIGLAQFQRGDRQTVWRLLALPFTGDTGDYAVNRRGKEPLKK